MTEKDGNFEISKFVGYNYPNVSSDVFRVSYRDLHCYHKDWRLLMPVVEKIESLGYKFQICRRRVEIDKDGYYGPQPQFLSKEENKITSVWAAVVKFIQFYNSQNQTTTP
jgi:hypothetical protein